MALHVAALVLAMLMLPLAAVVTMRVLPWLSALRRGARERKHVARLDGQGSLVVKGTLHVEGPAAAPGRALGALSVWSSGRRLWFRLPKIAERERAEKLTVVAGDKRYELRGAVEVLSGSRTTFSGGRARAWDERSYEVRTCLFDGDEVIVAGVAAGATDGQRYRERGATVIEPSVDAQVIFVCAAGRPATVVPIKALARSMILVPMLLLGLGPLYRFVGDYSNTECAEACKSFGLCSVASNFQVRNWRIALEKAWDGDHVDCAATSDALCRASTACGELGSCKAVAGDCVAASTDDCRNTNGCLSSGMCSPKDGKCRALSEADCHYTQDCIDSGRCTPREGACLDATSESCAQTASCTEYGRCTAIEGSCRPTSDDCERSRGCQEYGHCTAVDGRCQAAGDADCSRTTQCRERGLCSLVDGDCVAKADQDCRESTRCGEARECKAHQGACVPDAAKCRESAACAHWGRCDGFDLCDAGAKADCRKATVCQGKLDCRPLDNGCASTCQETEGCRRSGRCALADKDLCAAESNANCQASRMCREIGFCTFVGNACALTSSVDCAQSNGCKSGGRCSFFEGRCVMASRDCQNTEDCKRLGRCTPAGYKCIVGSADCQTSEVCQKFGWCTPFRPPFSLDEQCGPASK